MCFQRDPRGASTAGGAGAGGSSEAGTTFLVGTEGGKIFKCYNDANDVNTKASAAAWSRPRGKRTGDMG